MLPAISFGRSFPVELVIWYLWTCKAILSQTLKKAGDLYFETETRSSSDEKLILLMNTSWHRIFLIKIPDVTFQSQITFCPDAIAKTRPSDENTIVDTISWWFKVRLLGGCEAIFHNRILPSSGLVERVDANAINWVLGERHMASQLLSLLSTSSILEPVSISHIPNSSCIPLITSSLLSDEKAPFRGWVSRICNGRWQALKRDIETRKPSIDAISRLSWEKITSMTGLDTGSFCPCLLVDVSHNMGESLTP